MNDSIKTETREHRGHTITLSWHPDYDMGEPWKEHDGHGIVSGWEHRDKAPGELVLCSDRSAKRFYDYSGTLARARKEGWGLSDEGKEALARKLGHEPTAKEIRAESVMHDYQYLKDWCEDRWCWVWYRVEIEGMEYDDTLGGIDSLSMGEFEAEAFASAQSYIDRELTEGMDAACRDIVTA